MGSTSSKVNDIEALVDKVPVEYKYKVNEILQKLDSSTDSKVLQGIFERFPLELKKGLLSVWNENTSSWDKEEAKAQFLKLLHNIFNISSPNLFLVVSKASQESFYSLLKLISQLYFSNWGNKQNLEDPEVELFANYLLKFHWERELYHGEIDNDKVQDWKNRSTTVGEINEEEIYQWYSKNGSFQDIWKSCLLYGFLNIDINELTPPPQLVNGKMSSTTIWLLYDQVPTDCKKEWARVFSTEKDGASWNAFQRSLANIGSTVILIKEKGPEPANQFGAFSYCSWIPQPKFFGDGKAFLFSVFPELKAYPPTDYNQNYQYFNQGAHTLLNGLGLGGQLDYFGLWIDQTFEFGYSKANPRCSTYNSPQLSKSESFLIEEAEVWCLRKREVDDDEEVDNKLSILDSNPDAAAILEMSNHKMYSKDVRDPTLDL